MKNLTKLQKCITIAIIAFVCVVINGNSAFAQLQSIADPAPTVSAGADQTICSSTATISLSGAIGGAATSGTWSGGAGTFAPNATTLGAVYTPTAAEIAAGTVNLTLTTNDPAGTCGAASDVMVITINPAATVDAGVDQSVCSSSPNVTLSGTFGGGATSAIWSGGAGTYNPNNTTVNAIYTPTAAEIAAGTVNLTLTTNDPIGPCGTVSDIVVITIYQAATVNAGPDQTVCSSTTVALNGTLGGGATSAIWSGGAGTYNPNNTTVNAIYTPTAAEIAAGTVNLTLTTNDPIGPCTSVSDNMVITINPAATVDAGVDQSVCSSSPNVTLSGTFGGGATSAIWSGGAGTYNPNNTTVNAIYTPTAAEIAAGTVNLTLTTNDPIGVCGAISDVMVITIYQAATVNAGPDQTVCSSTTVALNGTLGGGATSAIWSGGAGTYNPNNTTVNAIYTPTAAEIAAGTVNLTLTTNDPIGPCASVNDQMTITIHQTPTIYTTTANGAIGTEGHYCPIGSSGVVFGLIGSQDNFRYDLQLYNSPYTSQEIVIGDGSAIDFMPVLEGLYRIVCTNPLGTCPVIIQ